MHNKYARPSLKLITEQEDARQVVVDGDDIFMESNPSVISARFSRVQFHPEFHIKISTDLYANEIDDMIALLTAAKTELARRATTTAQ